MNPRHIKIFGLGCVSVFLRLSALVWADIPLVPYCRSWLSCRFLQSARHCLPSSQCPRGYLRPSLVNAGGLDDIGSQRLMCLNVWFAAGGLFRKD